MKKALASIAALTAAGASFAGQADATSAAVQNGASYTVEANALNVRTGPDTANSILGVVRSGQTLQVIGETNGWYQIQYDGRTAYVSKPYVKSETIQASYQVSVSSLRVRTGPSTAHPAIGAVYKGQALTVIGEVQDWYKISYNGQNAYVSKSYVTGGTAAVAAQGAPAPGTYTVTADSLRMRKGPAVYEGIIGGLVKGTVLDVIGEENGWYKIRRGSTVGFVSKEYVAFTAGAAAAVTDTRYITVSSLNVRSGAGTDYQTLGSLSLGTQVEAADEGNGWLRISYQGAAGYIAKKYTSQTKPQTESTKEDSVKEESIQPQASSALVAYAKSLAGVPYLWGGSTPKGFDCSGFIYHVYRHSGYSFSRMSAAAYWSAFKKTTNPQPGDLIYFQNTYKPGISHMGIYLGNGSFIQAGDSGVAIGSLSSSYWSKHFTGYTKPY
ncbi:C40 family peptidase [Ectobacillus ponti]|uniref:SH3 domain-containing protein n=1 Tax=Ectobacillus ponti TaxID=2961894 RepID=A0AA42BN88_9BACI|nr:C40 family peptidase [Ectobacillus ponti]MCP8967705.1 SH3 domain-containing protein [Ectobacillus ponti]